MKKEIRKEEILDLIKKDMHFRRELIDILYEDILDKFPDLLEKKSGFRIRVVSHFADVIATKEEIKSILEELKNLREDSNRRFEEITLELKNQREDNNRRFEEITLELKNQREDNNRRFEEITLELKNQREDSNRRFEDNNRRFEEITLELKNLREDTNRRFEEINKRFEQIDKRFEQIDKRFEQIDKRFELLIAEMNRRFEQVDKRFQEMRDDFHKMITSVGSRWGEDAEYVFRSAINEILQKYYGAEAKEFFIEDEECLIKPYKDTYQVDLLITDGIDILIDVKSQADDFDVLKLHTLGEIYKKKTNKNVRLILVCVLERKEAKEAARKLGDVEIITRPREEFKPR